MNVPKTGRVWAKGPLLDSSIPTDAVITVSFPDGDPVPMERSGDQIRVLVAGAEATDNPAGTLVLPVEVPPIGVHTATVRVIFGEQDIPLAWGPFRPVDYLTDEVW